jgi:uncharacterized protein YkwD
MWQRQYFGHVNLDNETPFDRLKRGGIKFLAAGENLALAPNVTLAHQGLMNSPEHKENILYPTYKSIGIGAIDAGPGRGIMFVQEFTNP